MMGGEGEWEWEGRLVGLTFHIDFVPGDILTARL